MRIPRTWVRTTREVRRADGSTMLACAWGFSDGDREEARRRAEERLDRMAARLTEGREPTRGYAYGDRPLREEIVRELEGAGGEPVAVVTRNTHGCLVLNTARVLFADVDFGPQAPRGLLGRLLGRKGDGPAAEEEALARLRAGLDRAGGAFRIYRTAAGFRALATDRLYEPGGEAAERVLEVAGADPAFVRLCRLQQSFRARLSPKPWRCGTPSPPGRHPRESEDERRAFASWLLAYDERSARHATCRLVEEQGGGGIASEVAPLLRLHDESTRVGAPLPLA